ncbi:pleckstrin (PH) domain-containing protein [Tieghemostelium lacteum]|uniref:Pleckstrin (PH) domain-containing protein n=1 Tax=Tieghemostelium lacteum TaxID=361077 RepID=A0A151Z4E2_TIELA|nr:pleckstrin (PH) domain-containing protein [Tieghemostelium lacteum]|eukprot:KYQ88787.1 pleckstrin (PH) domain-containing protein [Tieghemostelium lacteum]
MVVEPSTAAGEICEKFAKKLFLNESDRVQFSLFILEGSAKTKLKVTDFPFDLLVKLEGKSDFKFCFLNPNGDFISFKPPTTTTTTTVNSNNNNNSSTVNKTPSKSVSRPGKGMSGFLLRKRANRFEQIWAVSKDKYLRVYESQDEETILYELSLENAVIELKQGGQSQQILLTLANSERHTFTSDKESDIQMWATELQCTTAYSASQTARVATPAMAFVPTARDLSVKLQSKLENNQYQSKAILAWVNHCLSGRQIQCADDIMTAFSDGMVLINLIDHLFKRQLKYRKGKSIYEMQYNIDHCLDTLKEVGADFGKLIAQDIIECKVVKVVLRLLWSIFIAFTTNGEKEYQAKDKLIGWCGRKISEFQKSLICDSPASLQNPLVFAALIAKHQPSALDYQLVSSKKSKVEQAQLILNAAHEKLQIPKILEASHWQDDNLDEKSFLLYLSMYYYQMSGEDREKSQLILRDSLVSKSPVEPENTQSARDKLLQAQKEKQEEDSKKSQQLQAQKEKERLEKERLEKERLDKEKLEKEKLERERLEKDKLEKERLEMERFEKVRLEQERLEQERLEEERLEQERLEQEELEKMERERLEQEEQALELQRQLDQQRLEQHQQQEVNNIDENDNQNEEVEKVNEDKIEEENSISNTRNLEYDQDDDNHFSPDSSKLTSSATIPQQDIIKEYQNRKFTKPLPQPVQPQHVEQKPISNTHDVIEEYENIEDNNTSSNNNNNNNTIEEQKDSKPIRRAIARICLEGFGEVLFCSFAINNDTLCGKVKQMVIKKMKVPASEEPEYFLYVVRDGLERVLEDDEILLEAEDKVDRFVFKKNDIERRYLLSNHRG